MHMAIPARPRVRRRWRVVVAAVAALFAGLAGLWWYRERAAEREFQEALDETDRLDPGWRLSDILAARRTVPDEQNSALQIIKARRALTGGSAYLGDPLEEAILGGPANQRMSVAAADGLRTYLAGEAVAREEAQKLKEMPDGRYPLSYDPDWRTYPLDWLQHVREMAHFLQLDMALRMQEGDLGEIAGACRAGINAGRSIGDEPSTIALLVRIACLEIAIGSLERALAQSDLPPDDLQTLQALVQREIDDPRLLWAMRGERAGGMQMVEGIYDGKVKFSTFATRVGKGNWKTWIQDLLPRMTGIDRAGYLRGMSQIVEAAKLPVEQQIDEVPRILRDCERQDAVLTSLLPACNKVVQAHARNEANLRCALVALAVERYRAENRSWPASLESLMQTGYLKAVPIDPFDGKQLRYRPTAEGVLVYSVGVDRIDNGGVVNRNTPVGTGVDLGFRLWNPELRRRPPSPAP
jgi:hypothetical protein